jgi:cell wall-associated NlpC family hydrolase
MWWSFSYTNTGWVQQYKSADDAGKQAYRTRSNLLGPFSSKDAAVHSLTQANITVVNAPGTKKKKDASGRQKKAGPSGALIVSLARAWLGVPYLYGGDTRQGVDCSGLVYNVAHEAGIDNCPRTSEEQWAWVQKIDEIDVGAGDLVFFVGAELDPPPGHVSIVVSRGTVISADSPGTVVRQEHYSPNGTGVAKVIGYGRMPNVSYSRSANYNVAGGSTKVAGVVMATQAGGAIASLVVIFFVVVLFLALVIVAIKFRS